MLRQYSASHGSEPQPACCIMRIIRNVMRVQSPARGGVYADSFRLSFFTSRSIFALFLSDTMSQFIAWIALP